MSRVKNYLTTGEAAAIFDVDPDTVLRWIKSGQIPAIRTPGGHYRIHRNVFLTKMIKDTSLKEKNETRPVLSYCWEYNSESGIIRNACKECIVYKSRASRCFELKNLPALIEHAKLFCAESCDDCQYFKSILQSAN
jgi:excisionase family DNA binding protein